MDVQACWRELLEFMADYHRTDDLWDQSYIREGILERLDNLWEWIRKSGDVPTV